jgi:hypothetical protein
LRIGCKGSGQFAGFDYWNGCGFNSLLRIEYNLKTAGKTAKEFGMKKFLSIALFLVLCTTVFAFEDIASAYISVYSDAPPLKYDFFSVDLRNMAEIILIGDYACRLASSNDTYLTDAPTIFENNTGLSQAVKNKMKQLGANVCMTFSNDFVYVNILMQNGTYTTIVY